MERTRRCVKVSQRNFTIMRTVGMITTLEKIKKNIPEKTDLYREFEKTEKVLHNFRVRLAKSSISEWEKPK